MRENKRDIQWVNCPECSHRLFRGKEIEDIEVKCPSCLILVDASIVDGSIHISKSVTAK